MNHYFVICDQEEGYVERFTALLNERKLVPWQIEGMTDADSLEEFCRTHRVEVLLIEEELYRERPLQFPARRLLLLSSVPSREEEGTLFKYQSVVHMMEKVMEGQRSEPPPERKRAVRLAVVYSPVKRSQRTLFALALGQILAKEQAVLYLDFSSMSGLSSLLGKEQEADLSDVLYLKGQGVPNQTRWKEQCLRTINNLDYVLPAQSPMDLHDAGADRFLAVLEEVEQWGEYRTLLLELDESCPAYLPVLQKSSVIYMPVEEDPLSAAQLAQYEQMMRRMGQASVLKKTVRVRPPWQSGLGDREQFVEQLVWGELGDYVRSLLWGQ